MRLQLCVGDRVRVCPLHEVLTSADETGYLDALLLMPKLAWACGRKFVTYGSAHWINDLVDRMELQRTINAVVLVGGRCDGSQHVGYEARKMLEFAAR